MNKESLQQIFIEFYENIYKVHSFKPSEFGQEVINQSIKRVQAGINQIIGEDYPIINYIDGHEVDITISKAVNHDHAEQRRRAGLEE